MIIQTELYNEYVEWFKKENIGCLFKNTDFYKRLMALNYKITKSNGNNVVRGLKLIDEM